MEMTRSMERDVPRRPPLVLVLLDRDGVLCINRFPGVLKLEDFEFVPQAREAMSSLNQPGFKVTVVTNQPYLDLGMLSWETFGTMNARLATLAKDAGIPPENFRILFCPHTPDENCSCRKPRTGMLEQARAELLLDMAKGRVYMVGDKISDIEAGVSFGRAHPSLTVKTVLIIWDLGDLPEQQMEESKKRGVVPSKVATSFMDAINWILEQEGNGHP